MYELSPAMCCWCHTEPHSFLGLLNASLMCQTLLAMCYCAACEKAHSILVYCWLVMMKK